MKRMIVILLFTLPLFAQMRHQVSKIEFRSRIPEKILRTQSALVEDHTYTDEELQNGVSRIRRLPFVYDAGYTLEGTTLVIFATDEHHFFYLVDLSDEQFPNRTEVLLGTAVGYRMYLRNGAILDGSLGSQVATRENFGSFDAQYSQYGIAGTRAFVIAAVSKGTGLFGDSDVEPHLTVGYPLSLTQTVSFVASHSGFHNTDTFAGLPRPLETKIISDTFEFHWTYDTTNDPFFGLRGRALDVVPNYVTHDNHFEGFTRIKNVNVIQTFDETGSDTGLRIEGINYWPLRTRSTAFVRLDADTTRSDLESRPDAGVVTSSNPTHRNIDVALGVAHNFFDFATRSASRHRVELSAGVVRETLAGRINGPDTSNDFTEASLGYAYRNRWGSVRLGFTWVSE